MYSNEKSWGGRGDQISVGFDLDNGCAKPRETSHNQKGV